jgi:hypothetical protein
MHASCCVAELLTPQSLMQSLKAVPAAEAQNHVLQRLVEPVGFLLK